MVTTIFFHAASSAVSGTLPATSKSTTNTAGASPFDAQTVNRSMNTTIGTSNTAITSSSVTTTAMEKLYISRFVSDPLDSSTTTVTAQTWTHSTAYSSVANTAFFPAGQSGGGSFPGVLYVWRPSTGAKVGTIFDSASGVGSTSYGKSTLEKTVVCSVIGSGVTGATGDVIILEAWGLASAATSQVYSFYVDGTDSTFTDNQTNATPATNITTPQSLVFSSAPSPVACTVTGKSIIPDKLWT